MSGPDVYKESTKTYGSCDDLLNTASEKFVSDSSTHNNNTRKFGATQLRNNNLLNQGNYDVAPMEQAERQELRRISLELVKPGKGKLPPPLPRKVSMADILNRSSLDESNEFQSDLIMPPAATDDAASLGQLSARLSSPSFFPKHRWIIRHHTEASSRRYLHRRQMCPPFGFPTSPKLQICPPPPSMVPGVHLGSKIHQSSDFSNNSVHSAAPPPPPTVGKHSQKKSNFPNTSMNQAPPPPPLFHSSATHNPPPPPLHTPALPSSLPAFPISPAPSTGFSGIVAPTIIIVAVELFLQCLRFFCGKVYRPPTTSQWIFRPHPCRFQDSRRCLQSHRLHHFQVLQSFLLRRLFQIRHFHLHRRPPSLLRISIPIMFDGIQNRRLSKKNDPQTELFAAILKRRSNMENEQ